MPRCAFRHLVARQTPVQRRTSFLFVAESMQSRAGNLGWQPGRVPSGGWARAAVVDATISKAASNKFAAWGCRAEFLDLQLDGTACEMAFKSPPGEFPGFATKMATKLI